MDTENKSQDHKACCHAHVAMQMCTTRLIMNATWDNKLLDTTRISVNLPMVYPNVSYERIWKHTMEKSTVTPGKAVLRKTEYMLGERH